MPKKYLNPQTLFPSQQFGFSQVVVATGKAMVYVSGQVGWDPSQQISDGNDLSAQTRRSLENLDAAMKAAGGTRSDIVSLRIYIVGEHIHNALAVREALLNFFSSGKLPTSTWIGVPALASRDFLIEIEAVAVLD